MANLTEDDLWVSGIYQLEQNDSVQAGTGGAGIANLQAVQLANRTGYLKALFDNLIANALSLGGDPPQFDSSQLPATTNWVNNNQHRFVDVKRIVGNTTLIAADIGKFLVVDGLSANNFEVDLPSVNVLPPGVSITIKHESRYPLKWKAAGSELFLVSLWYYGPSNILDELNSNVFYTQYGDLITLTRSATNTVLGSSTPYWQVLPQNDNIDKVGEVVFGWFSQNTSGFAFVPKHVTCLPMQGQIVARADYPRLWDWIQRYYSHISGGVPNDAAWTGGANKEYSSGDGTTTFRLPLIPFLDTALYARVIC